MEFKLHQSFTSLLALETNWNELVEQGVTKAPFLRFEYLKTWWETLGGGEWDSTAKLTVITAFEDQELIGIAPLFLAKNRDGQDALLLLGSIEISDYLDLIVKPEFHTVFSINLIHWLKTEFPYSWQVIDWYNIPDDSPSLSVFDMESEKLGLTDEQSIYQPCPFIPLPGDFETYLGSLDKKQRHEIRRKLRRAEESGRNVHWYIADDEKKLDSNIKHFISLMAQDPHKQAFLTPAMIEQFTLSSQEAFKAGYLQMAFLEVDGEKACAYLNFDYQNKIWVYNSGLDKRFMDLSAGWVLLAYLLRWANENKRTEFDFLRGEEDYKLKFGGHRRAVMRLKLTRK